MLRHAVQCQRCPNSPPENSLTRGRTMRRKGGCRGYSSGKLPGEGGGRGAVTAQGPCSHLLHSYAVQPPQQASWLSRTQGITS